MKLNLFKNKIKLSTRIAYSIICHKYKLIFIFLILSTFSILSGVIYYFLNSAFERFNYAFLLLADKGLHNEYIQSNIMQAFIIAWLHIIFILASAWACIMCISVLIKILKIIRVFNKKKLNIRPLNKNNIYK